MPMHKDCEASAVVNMVRPESYRAMGRFAIRLRVVFSPGLRFVRISWLDRQSIARKLSPLWWMSIRLPIGQSTMHKP
jgi:hypothetical protein